MLRDRKHKFLIASVTALSIFLASCSGIGGVSHDEVSDIASDSAESAIADSEVIADLKSRIDDLESSKSELESTNEDLEARISDLESRSNI